MKKQINLLDKVKNNLINDKAFNLDQIQNLQNELNQIKQNLNNLNNNNFKNENIFNSSFSNEYNKTFKDNFDYENEINRLNILNRKFANQNELLKAEYEKKIQILDLNNHELNSKIQYLLNSLIALKDYALSVEKNSNNIYLSNFNEKINEIIKRNYNNINNDENYEINKNNNIINNETKDNNTNNNIMNYNEEYCREMIKTMKEIINKIDSKI